METAHLRQLASPLRVGFVGAVGQASCATLPWQCYQSDRVPDSMRKRLYQSAKGLAALRLAVICAAKTEEARDLVSVPVRLRARGSAEMVPYALILLHNCGRLPDRPNKP